MTFGEAIERLKAGHKVMRRGWNGKGMHLWLHPGLIHQEGGQRPFIVMYTAQGGHQGGWLASQADMLEEDWEAYNG